MENKNDNNIIEESENADSINYTESGKAENGKRPNRLITAGLAMLFFAAYFTMMAFTFADGIDGDVILWAVVLYALSAACWAAEFMSLMFGNPHFLQRLAGKYNSRALVILSHIAMMFAAFGLLAIQFALR